MLSQETQESSGDSHTLKRKSSREDIRRLLDSTLVSTSASTSDLKRTRLEDALDRDGFYQRLSTYQPLLWSGFHPITPIECARFGWKVVGVDLLKCISCDAILFGKLASSSNPYLFQKSVDQLRAKLTTQHKKFCKWASVQVPESFGDLQLDSINLPEQIVKEVILMLRSFSDFIPKFTERTRAKIASEQLFYWLCKSTDLNPKDTLTINAFVLTLTGWNIQGNQRIPLISCKLCNKKCGAWIFQSTFDPDVHHVEELFPDPLDVISEEIRDDIIEQEVGNLLENAIQSVENELQNDEGTTNIEHVEADLEIGDVETSKEKNVSSHEVRTKSASSSSGEQTDEEIIEHFNADVNHQRFEENRSDYSKDNTTFTTPSEINDSGSYIRPQDSNIHNLESDQELNVQEGAENLSSSQSIKTPGCDEKFVKVTKDEEHVGIIDRSIDTKQDKLSQFSEHQPKDYMETNKYDSIEQKNLETQEETDNSSSNIPYQLEEEKSGVESSGLGDQNEDDQQGLITDHHNDSQEPYFSDNQSVSIESVGLCEDSASEKECEDLDEYGNESVEGDDIFSGYNEEDVEIEEDVEEEEVSEGNTDDHEGSNVSSVIEIISSDDDVDDQVPNMDGQVDIDDCKNSLNSQKQFFNPINNHMPWCPWVRTTSGWMKFVSKLNQMCISSEPSESPKKDQPSAMESLQKIQAILNIVQNG